MAELQQPVLGPLAARPRTGVGVFCPLRERMPEPITLEPVDVLTVRARTYRPPLEPDLDQLALHERWDPWVNGGQPLWPETPAGERLQSRWRFYGERYLCTEHALEDEPCMWWTEDGSYRR